MSEFEKLWVENDRNYYEGNQNGGWALQVAFLVFILVLALFV